MEYGSGSAGSDGWPADVVFDGASNGYTYDDLLLMPGQVTFEASAADLTTRLTRNLTMKLPLVSSPSDTITEAEMATEMALAGGVGVIHYNQSIQSQSDMVKQVKRHHNGFIYDPVTLSPGHTVADVDRIKATHGFSGIPITDNGELGGKIMGIVTSRDIDAVDDRSTPISQVMTRQVVLGREGLTLTEAYAMLQQKKVGKLPIVNEEMRLTSLVARGDWKRIDSLKNATRDSKGQLLVGAGVSVDTQDAWDRTMAVVEAGADFIYLDTSGARNGYELDFISRLKATYPQIDVVAGPVLSCREAASLCDAGVDAIVVGSPNYSRGLGQESSSVGRAEATATFQVARYVTINYGLPSIAQGGLRNSGHILKALSLGASSVLLDDFLGATTQAAGREIFQDGACTRLAQRTEGLATVQGFQAGHKSDRMASMSTSNASAATVGKGSVRDIAPYIETGLCNGLSDLGIQSMPDLHRALLDGDLRMECQGFYGQKQAELRALAVRNSRLPYVHPSI